MSSNTCEKKVVSVWFVCRSCEFTFPFRTVDEFLDHKKEEHFSEFQNTHCIVLEERKEINDRSDDGNQNNLEEVEIKLFTEDERDIPIELCTNPNTIFSLEAEPLVPVPVPVLLNSVAASTSSDRVVGVGHTDSMIETPNPFREKESELNNADFGLFSVRSWSSDHNPEDNLCDLELEVGQNLSPNTNEAASQNPPQLVQFVHVSSTVENNKSTVIFYENSNPDFSLSDIINTDAVDEVDDETKFQGDAIGNFENNSSATSTTSKNPYVLLRRLTSKELRSFNPKYSTSKKRRLKVTRSARDASHIQSDPLTLTSTLTPTPLGPSNLFSPANNGIQLDRDVPEVDVSEGVQVNVNTPVKCGLCGKTLSSESKAKTHVTRCWLRIKSKKNCYCAPCNKTLSSPTALKYHIRVKHIERRKRSIKIKAKAKRNSATVKRVEHKCHTCSKIFNRASSLRCHLETHVPLEKRERPFVCEICGKTFIGKYHLTAHLGTHAEDRRFKCPRPDCTSAFKISGLLTAHLKTHAAEYLFPCPKDGCSKRFRTRKNLGLHLKSLRHTGVYKPKSWKCNQQNCDKLYLFRASLDRHMIVAHGIGGQLPTFECDICKKTFTWKICLTKHYQTHTENRPFKCSYEGCDKAYKDKGALVQHVHGKHTGERHYQCELCGKAYYQRSSLSWHMAIHQKSKQIGLKE